MKNDVVRNIIKEEVEKQLLIQEVFSAEERRELKTIIRDELSDVFYDLFRKRTFWVD